MFRSTLGETLKYIRRRGYNCRQILIVGRNDRSAEIARKIQEAPEFGAHILGFIDALDNDNEGGNSYNFNLVGNLEDLERILREEVVDEVFVTLPLKSFYSDIEEIAPYANRLVLR